MPQKERKPRNAPATPVQNNAVTPAGSERPANRFTPTDMRRAVILSEVLGRPIALRRRGGR